MAKPRSPNYPAISLRDALDRVRKVYEKEHTTKASPDVVVKAMGYASLNGASMTILSALKKYGLLEEIGKELKVSGDALTILVDPKESQERIAAIRRAAFTPSLFSELRQQYGDSSPSDENIRSFLLKRGFLQSTVDNAIRAYRDTLALVSEFPNGDNPNKSDPDQETSMDKPQEAFVTPKTQPHSGNRRDIFSLDEGQVILEWPEKMSSESFEDFQSWLELQLRKIKRSIN